MHLQQGTFALKGDANAAITAAWQRGAFVKYDASKPDKLTVCASPEVYAAVRKDLEAINVAATDDTAIAPEPVAAEPEPLAGK